MLKKIPIFKQTPATCIPEEEMLQTCCQRIHTQHGFVLIIHENQTSYVTSHYDSDL